MAFIAPLVEAGAEAGGAEAAAGAGEEAGSGGLFNKIPQAGQGEQNKQQNSGDSRNFNFRDAFNSIRSAVRPGGGGVD